MNRIELSLDPWEVLERWPDSVPVAAAIAGDGAARWSMIGVADSITHDLDAVLASCGAPASSSRGDDVPPMSAGWIGSIGYEWGWETEPGATEHAFGAGVRTPPRRGVEAVATFARVESALAHDHQTGSWWEVGGGTLHRQLDAVTSRSFEVGAPRSLMGKAAYIAAVERALEYVRAGDVYQANIAHELRAAFGGRPLDWFIARGRAAKPRYGAFVQDRLGSRAVASLSPELLLEHTPHDRRLITRPMKGTRPAEAAMEELTSAAKDRAELAMIVDLLRNDLGRVSELGSVRVHVPHEVERHGSATGGVLQATATVHSTLRAGLGVADAIRGCFPGGSVTGAPKVRAMQVIEELECSPRGPYCGACGVIADDGWVRLNVAIRTAVFGVGEVSYRVGAGIVADSDPASEWEETWVKARAAWPVV